MKIKESRAETLIYIIACIFTFGAVCVVRCIITMAIRKALENG